MVGTGEIKYPGWTKISTAARQFDIDLSGLEEENLDQRSPRPPGWGLIQRASSSLITEKQEMLKKNQTPSLGLSFLILLILCKLLQKYTKSTIRLSRLYYIKH